MEERLQKIIARAGIASRRHAEQLIASGLVTVNGKTVTELGSKADAARDHIKVSGKLLRPAKEPVYIALNKPGGVVSTMEDPEGRRSLRDLLHGISERVFPIGRLEYNASGLLLLTNDGELANQLMQAHGLRQTYHIKVKGRLMPSEIEELSRATGARISRLQSGRAQASNRADAPWYEVTLSEARRDALRNRLFQSDHPVEKMKRVGLGGVELGRLAPGAHRPLSGGELVELRKALKKTPVKKTPANNIPSSADPGGGGKNPKTNRDKHKPPIAHYKA
ncbi:MAG TPA: pseudouridine synthase [Candidatus Acidoferrum sp.]|nr:pseudouridine synthase [Candidatus Acidoferrum sp.]